MEDEECLPENSNLRLYLEDLGFSDIQVKNNTLKNLSHCRFDIFKPKSHKPYVDTVDEDVINQISIIVSTRMLFEEDIAHIEKLLSHFKVVKKGIFKSIFGGVFGISVVFLGLGLYWFIGYYAFFLISIFYAFRSADYLSKKHFAYSRLKKLTSILESNFMLLKKIVKFIEENRLVEANSVSQSNSSEFIEGFSFFDNFKSDFLLSIKEMIQILLSSTQKLISTIPLYDYIENTDLYLCNNFNTSFESNNLLKLYEIYLLVQSEFLQRLILSLIPNLRTSSKSSFKEVNKILTETCVKLLKTKNKSSKKFKFIFLNGVHSQKSKVDFKIPLERKSVNKYYKELIFNIHETSKTFQQLLLQCRSLEESFTQEKFSVNLELELLKLQRELSECHKSISDSIILLKKSNHIDQKSSRNTKVEIQGEEELQHSDFTEKIVVGYSDLNPKIEDEIFEAYFSDENRRNLLEENDWNLEEKLEQKFEKEFSKNVLKELKLKIAEKAEYWKKREKELLQKKGIFDVNECSDDENTVQKMKKKCLDDENKENECSPNLSVGCPKQCQNYENYANNLSDLINLSSKQLNNCLTSEGTNSTFETCDNASAEFPNSYKNENSSFSERESHLGSFSEEENFESSKQKFLNDINKARTKIFSTSIKVEEELFYTSGEDSSSE